MSESKIARPDVRATNLVACTPPSCPTVEEAQRWLSEHEVALPRRRRWKVQGAIKVYFGVLGVLSSGQKMWLAYHRRTHRRHAPGKCARLCQVRDLWLQCFTAMKDLAAPRAMPFVSICGAIFDEQFDWHPKNWTALHDAVWRDAKHLRAVLTLPASERSAKQKRLLRRYAVSTMEIIGRQIAADEQITSGKNSSLPH